MNDIMKYFGQQVSGESFDQIKISIASPEQIRSSFDAEIAFLMTFFKMSIDSRVINAAVYANIVHQADVEISFRKRST